MNTPDDVIQTSVREYNRIIRDYVVQQFTALLTGDAAHFENIGKIGRETNSKGNVYRIRTVVDNLKTFVADSLPEELSAQHMQGPARNDDFAVPGNIRIG